MLFFWLLFERRLERAVGECQPNEQGERREAQRSDIDAPLSRSPSNLVVAAARRRDRDPDPARNE